MARSKTAQPKHSLRKIAVVVATAVSGMSVYAQAAVEPKEDTITVTAAPAPQESAWGPAATIAARQGTVAKLAMRQPFVLFKGLTFQKLCLPGAFRPGDHHNKMLRPGLCVVHASPQYL